ncbi:MAG: lysophospholipid acyltransferase family protein [Candidatus Omnitrophota bacterium]|jgi:KDO2-lipid IV(A) lauroyltransferase
MLYIFLFFRIFALTLPRSFSYAVIKFFALLKYYICPKDRRAVLYNLEPLVKDVKERKKCAKEVFVNFGYYLVDFLRYSKFNKSFIDRFVTIEGLNNLEQASKAGRGVVFLSAHLGNYELGGAVCASLGHSFSAVALPHKNKGVNDFFNNQRAMVGIDIIPTGMAVKRCYSLLRQGGMLGLVGDRVFIGDGIEVDILNRKCLLPKGPAVFSVKTLAPIVPSFFVRENKYFYKLIFEKPIYPCNDNKEYKYILDEYAEVLGTYIKQYPQQWYIFQKHWL